MNVVVPAKYHKLSAKERRQVREHYQNKVQHGRCWFCNNPLIGLPVSHVASARIDMGLFPRGFIDHPIHLHHSHVTGMTIGAVHARCNAYLWQYEGQ